MSEAEVIRALGALAQASRLQVFRALVVAGQGGLTPSHLSETLGVPGTALSFHLKELLGAALVSQERQGRHLIYRADFPAMQQLMGYLLENCCAGAPCAADSSCNTCA